MVPYLTERNIVDAFKQKYNEDINHFVIPQILFEDNYHNDSAKELYIDDPWWRYEDPNEDEEMRALIMIMEMLFEEFYPQRYVLVDTSW
jgi:hypothetical protein